MFILFLNSYKVLEKNTYIVYIYIRIKEVQYEGYRKIQRIRR